MRKILLTLILFSSISFGAGEGPIVGLSFDADDNLFNLPTKIVLFHRTIPNKTVEVSTGQFAQVRTLLGVEGAPSVKIAGETILPAQYELRPDRATGSYRYFSDAHGETDERGNPRNFFLEDLKKAMAGTQDWRADAWDEFIIAMNNPETVMNTTIITARGHAPETIQMALRYLQEQGRIKYIPAAKNIWTVSNPQFSERFEDVFGVAAPEGDAASPSGRKAAIMEQILDHINAVPIPETAPKITATSGTGLVHSHTWGFSDDDRGNFDKALKVIQTGLDTGRWPKVKITLFFTGKFDVPKERAIVLVPNQAPRPFTKKEDQEWQNLIAYRTLRSSDCLELLKGATNQ